MGGYQANAWVLGCMPDRPLYLLLSLFPKADLIPRVHCFTGYEISADENKISAKVKKRIYLWMNL